MDKSFKQKVDFLGIITQTKNIKEMSSRDRVADFGGADDNDDDDTNKRTTQKRPVFATLQKTEKFYRKMLYT